VNGVDADVERVIDFDPQRCVAAKTSAPVVNAVQNFAEARALLSVALRAAGLGRK
jgi:hypothetical protein